MYAWQLITDVFRSSLFALSHVCGSMGLALITLSFLIRVVSFPLRVRVMARRGKLMKGLLTIPLAAALYSVVREAARAGGGFLWIRNLSRPDALLGLVGAIVSAIAVLSSPATQNVAAQNMQRVAMVLPILLAFLMMSKIASGVGIYWIASSAMSTGERLIARRRAR
jgi:membrane protein insertase Oxa1/YidC/SpoIIIJ